MNQGNEYRQRQVLSLKDEIAKLQGDLSSARKEIALWKSNRKQHEDELNTLDRQIFAAKDAHKSLIKSHDAEIEDKKAKIEELNRSHAVASESHAEAVSERQEELADLDEAILDRTDIVNELVIQESNLRFAISRLSTDKVLALKDTARALEENRKAVQKLSQIQERILQAEKDHQAGDAERKRQADALQAWQERLEIRDSDLNVLSARMKPEFVKIYGEHEIHKKVFEPSK